MRTSLRHRIRHALFWFALLFMGSIVVESDIITGHHEMERLQRAAIHYVEEPIEDKEKE